MTQLDLQQKLEQAEHREQSAASAAVLLAEKVAEVKAERDALQQQVNALAAENLGLKSELDFWDQDPIKTTATDAIKRQWMAEGAIAVRNAIVTAEDGSNLHKICTDVAEQFRHPEEKGHE